MAGKGQVGRYPIRLTVFVTEEMDDHLDDMAELMQITKQEYIRHVLGTSRMGYVKAVDVLKENTLEDGFGKVEN